MSVPSSGFLLALKSVACALDGMCIGMSFKQSRLMVRVMTWDIGKQGNKNNQQGRLC